MYKNFVMIHRIMFIFSLCNNNNHIILGSQHFQGARSQDSGYNTTNYSQSSQEEGSFTCQCGAPAIIRTVRKEGPNQGNVKLYIF